MFTCGEACILEVVELVDQEYNPPGIDGVATNVPCWPLQMIISGTLTVGISCTIIFLVISLVGHPAPIALSIFNFIV